jgi:hypothetical protein
MCATANVMMEVQMLASLLKLLEGVLCSLFVLNSK